LNDPFELPSIEEIEQMERNVHKPSVHWKYPATLSSVKGAA